MGKPKNKSKKASAKTVDPGLTMATTLSNMVNDHIEKMKADLMASCASPRKRNLSESSESDCSIDSPITKRARSTRLPDTPSQASASQSAPPKTPIQSSFTCKNYKTQVVILDGVDDTLKKNPARLTKALNTTKPDLEISNIRLTASNSVLITPKNPKDVNSLLKPDAFPKQCTLGKNVTARLPKSQVVTYQVIIKGLDTSVTEDEVKEMLDRQELGFISVKRIWSRARDCATEMMRLVLKDEQTKKQLLKNGLYLDQMRFKCVAAREDEEKKLVFQCFKCQALNDHKTWECKNEQKCVLCAGPHMKSECNKSKEEAKCSNCDGNHGAWSRECPKYREAVDKKKTYSSATKEKIVDNFVNDTISTMLKSLMEELKKLIAVVIAEVTSKALLEHVFYENEFKKSGGTKYLKANDRISSIVKMTTNSINKTPLSSYDCSQLENETVHTEVMERLKESLQGNSEKMRQPSTQS